MTKVFFAYKQRDPDFAVLLDKAYQNLIDEGFEVFRDVNRMEYGKSWITQVIEAIEQCDVGCVFWTPAAAISTDVQGEAESLQDVSKYCGVVLKEKCVPPHFRIIQQHNFGQWGGDRNAACWKTLIAHLRSLGQRSTEHPVPPPAPPGSLIVAGARNLMIPTGPNLPAMIAYPAPHAFTMGASAQDETAPDQEKTSVQIRFARGFAVSEGPITAGEWRRARREGARISEPNSLNGADEAAPMVDVSWIDTMNYISWLNYLTGAALYRLPSEAEWEYAARQRAAGGLQRGPTQVWEWVADTYSETRRGTPEDGAARKTPRAAFRCARGGSFRSMPFERTVTARTGFHHAYHASDLGFSVARDLTG